MSLPLKCRLQGLFWQYNHLFRRPLRDARLQLSLLRYRWRVWRQHDDIAPRVVPRPIANAEPLPHPAIVVLPEVPGASNEVPGTSNEAHLTTFLERQTENSTCRAGSPEARRAAFCWQAGAGLSELPPNHLEALLLVMAAEDPPCAIADWSAPSPSVLPNADLLCPVGDEINGSLFRMPTATPRGTSSEKNSIVARAVPHITGNASTPASQTPLTVASGPYLLRGDSRTGQIVRAGVLPVDQRLANLPEISGPATALFVLPFLVIGGAERLLFDLLSGWQEKYRALVVTLEPHSASLGQTVDTCRRLTPWLYTLGDWLPREAQYGALTHLIRRYRVETLFSWNGTVAFYDLAPALKRRFPKLRVIDQLYNHHGGWIEHYSPRLRQTLDHHVAINSRIAEALENERGVDPERITVIHHGVDVPPEVDPATRQEQRERSRRALGLPQGKLIVGTFIRLHAQKRPLDILQLARRFSERGVHFLLAGGGPLDEAIDRELARRPLANLTRLPLQNDVEPLYDAIDLGLMTSAYEGLPVFLLDALARGIPCVATAVGEIPLLFDDGGGVLVERPGDLDALEHAVAQLLDSERRQLEGERGRRKVTERFGLQRYREGYEKVIFRKSGAEKTSIRTLEFP